MNLRFFCPQNIYVTPPAALRQGKLTVTPNRSLLKFARRNPCVKFMPVSSIELKKKIIDLFELEDVTPDQIDDDAPLFGPGLGLDSIDALELVVLLERDYGIVIKDMESGRPAFQSVRTLAAFIEAHQSS